MPTYTNTSEIAKVLPGYSLVQPDATQETSYYIWPLPNEFELTADTPRNPPVIKLHDAVLPVAISSGLAAYTSLLLQNQSGNAVSIVFDGDTDNTFKCAASKDWTITYNKNYNAVSITGAGSTAVQLYGFR